MNIIKFRAWDKNSKVMYNGINPFKIEYGSEAFNNFAWKGDVGVFEAMTIGESNYQLMQYIGKSDKNGTEIYADDIVNYMFNYDDDKLQKKAHRYTGFITWCPDHCAFEIVSNSEKNHGLIFNSSHFCVIEVIGNKHENPSLLTTGQ